MPLYEAGRDRVCGVTDLHTEEYRFFVCQIRVIRNGKIEYLPTCQNCGEELVELDPFGHGKCWYHKCRDPIGQQHFPFHTTSDTLQNGKKCSNAELMPLPTSGEKR